MSPSPPRDARRRFLLLLTLLACASSCASWAPQSDPAGVVRGPLPTRNQHPVALTFLHMRPRRAATTAEGQWDFGLQAAYSSIYEVESIPGQVVEFDGEIARASLRMRRGLDERTDLEIEVAGQFASSGFLDDFVNGFHDLFHLPDQGRHDAEDDSYAMSLARDGQRIYELEEDTPGFADLPIVVTHRVRDEDSNGPGVALRFGVELPTGSEERGFGNGEVDAGAGVLFERSLGRWTWTGALDAVATGDPDRWEDAGVEARELYSVQAGAEYRWNDRLSLLAQIFWTSPMTRDFTVEEFDREIADLAIGASWGEGGGKPRWFAAFQEDLVAATGTDFGFLVGVAWGF